jgi:hypothetical protein
LSFYKIGIVLIVLLGSIFQHIVHECSHIFVARLNGIKIIKVNWLTYPRFLLGTRVFYDNEPKINNDNVKIVEKLRAFRVEEYMRDLSVNHSTAQNAYYASQMNVRRRQLVCDVNL